MSEAEVLEDLPAEMQQAVFSHLDLPSVRALRRVSHAVRALIGSRDFQKARHSVRSEPAHPSPACSLEACIHRQSSMPRAAPTFRPSSAHQPLGALPAVTGSSFDTGVASAQPGRAPVASAEEEAGLRDRICRGRRAGDRAGGPQPPASAAAAATATATATHHRRSCARVRFRERLDERLDERLGIRARTRPLEQRVQCRRLQPELGL